MMKPLPSGPWEALFPRAILLIAEIERHGGASDPQALNGVARPRAGLRRLRVGPMGYRLFV